MRASLLLSVLCFGLPASAFAAETGTYRPGQSYSSVVASSANQCAAQCKGDAQCKGWNFIRPRQMSRTGVCEFNAQKATPVPSPASVSGDNETVRSSGNIVSAGTRTVRVGSQPAAPVSAPTMPPRPAMPTATSAPRRAPTPSMSGRMTSGSAMAGKPMPSASMPHSKMSREPIIYGQTHPQAMPQTPSPKMPMTSGPMPQPLPAMPMGQRFASPQNPAQNPMMGYRMVPNSGIVIHPQSPQAQMAGQQLAMSQQAINQLISPQVMAGLVASLPGMAPQSQGHARTQAQAPMGYGQQTPMSAYSGQPMHRPMFQHNLDGTMYTPHGNATRARVNQMRQTQPRSQGPSAHYQGQAYARPANPMPPKSSYDPNHMPMMPMTGNAAPRLPMQSGMSGRGMPQRPSVAPMSPEAMFTQPKPYGPMTPKSMYDPNHMPVMPMTGNALPRLPQQSGMGTQTLAPQNMRAPSPAPSPARSPVRSPMGAPLAGAVASHPYAPAPQMTAPRRGLYGSLHDDVTVPRALSRQDIPSNPNAPIQTVSSMPVTPVSRAPMPQMQQMPYGPAQSGYGNRPSAAMPYSQLPPPAQVPGLPMSGMPRR